MTFMNPDYAKHIITPGKVISVSFIMGIILLGTMVMALVTGTADVTLGQVFGDFREVNPTSSGALQAGARVVFDGTHYIQDGETVNAFDEVEVKP